jgi:hypothetical protein
MCVPCGSAPRERIDLRAVGLRIPLTRLEVRGEARERLLSCRDPASRDPRTGCVSETCSVLLRTRAPFRLLSARASRQARLRASFRLAPCVRREALRPLGDQDARCVQPTSATRTKNVYPYLVRSWQAPRLAPRAGREEFGLRATRPGKGAFHDAPASLRRVWPGTHSSCVGNLTRLSRPRACSTRGAPRDRASDTPVAPLVPSERPEPSLVGTRRARVRTRRAGRKKRVEPRPPGPRSRERARCVTTRGAFHRQGALPRIRWRSPLARCSPRSHDLARFLSDPADRRVTFSRHPGTSPIPRPGSTARSGSRSSFRSGHAPDRETSCDADCRSLPRARSLFTRAVPLLGGLCASVFGTRRRLTTSATATTYGHLAWALRVLAFVEGGRNLRPGSDASGSASPEGGVC